MAEIGLKGLLINRYPEMRAVGLAAWEKHHDGGLNYLVSRAKDDNHQLIVYKYRELKLTHCLSPSRYGTQR